MYILLLPFTSVFALSSTITVGLVFICLFMLTRFFSIKSPVFLLGDLSWVILLCVAVVSCGLNMLFTGFYWSQLLNLVSITVVFVVFFYGARQYISYIGLDFAYTMIFIATIIVCCFGFVEFMLNNYTAINIDAFLYRPSVPDMDAVALGLFERSRSVTAEPGHLAYFYSIFFPLCYFYLRHKPFLTLVSSILFMVSFLLTFSAAGFGIALFVSAPIVLCHMIKSLRAAGVLLLVVGGFVFGLSSIGVIDVIVQVVQGKLTIASGSGEHRWTTLTNVLDLYVSSGSLVLLFGLGPGFYKSSMVDPAISFYVNLVAELGIAGLLAYMVFWLWLFLEICKMDGSKRIVYLISFLNASVYFAIVGNYWYPWFWFLCAMVISENLILFRNEKG